MTNRPILYLMLLALSLVMPICAQAQEQTMKDYQKNNEKYRQDIVKIEAYLNSLKTFAAGFTQKADDGEVTTGMFYLSRPGKLRWDYDPPHKIIIIAKGALLTYYDAELDQVSHVGIDDNLAGFLTQEKISFSKGVEITNVVKEKGAIAITVDQADKKDEGKLTMVFLESTTVELEKLIVLDAAGKLTTVTFQGATPNAPVDSSLFVLPAIHHNKK
jgi:outer membrane lipoprotein-sorting protein